MILVDCDPDGLNIFFCYRYGSSRQRQPANIAVTWWGIQTKHILDIGKRSLGAGHAVTASSQASSTTSVSSTTCREPISHLSNRDRKLAVSTLKKSNDLPQDDDVAEELKMELQRMLMLGVKTEIQWLDEAGSITQWLDDEMGMSLSEDIDGI